MDATNNIEQGSPAWFAQRMGNVTASRIHSLLAKPKQRGQSESAARRNYKAQLVCELITGQSLESDFMTYEMKRGLELEPDARSKYEFVKGVAVETCGFIKHSTIPRFGCSPDGLVGDDGLVQIKCLNRANHMECITSGIPTEYEEQMIAELSCTGRQWNDFVSYHPDFPEHMKLYVKRITREQVKVRMEEIEAQVQKFNAEVDETIRHLPKKESLEEQLTASIAAANNKLHAR